MEYMESKMQDYIENGISEADRCYARIAELELQVDTLQDALQCLFNDIGGGKKFCGHEFSCVCAGDKARTALNTLPQHHLEEIRAEAGRDGFVAGYMLCNDGSPLIKHNYEGFADKYADSIRQGVE